jgi:flagellin
MTVNNIARNQMGPAMTRLASGQRINSAADDAAGLAIVESMTAQVRGLDQGTRNTMDMQALVNTAEGGLDTISGSLNRIRELSVQAANGTLSQANRDMIQEEIGQLANHIQSTVNNGVQFNTMNLLDGSGAQGLHTASGADGAGAIVIINDMRDMARAVTDFNVAEPLYRPLLDADGDPVLDADGEQVMERVHSHAAATFNINEIDQFINEVVGERANLGAMHNRFDYTVATNQIANLNMAAARSGIQDADIALAVMEREQASVLEEAQLRAQERQQEQEAQTVLSLF